MPLITKNEDAPISPPPASVRIADPLYKGITVDTRYQPTETLMTVLEGSSWIVNYYSQVIDDDSYLNGQMTNTKAPFQQYILINNFEFKVNTPLTASQNNETKEMQLTGSAAIHPSLVPNVGDMFIADIGDGREGIFRITSSETRSIFKDTAHIVEYELISYSTELRRNDLAAKTIKVTYYVKDNNYYGQNPIVEEEEYFLVRYLNLQLNKLIEKYFSQFFSNEYQSLMLPGQDYPIYDHFLVKACKTVFNTNEQRYIQYIRQMNVSDDQTMNAFSLWDAVINKDRKLMYHIFKTYGTISVRTFTIEPMMESIYHSGFEYVIYPKDNEVSVDYDVQKKKKEVFENVVKPTNSVVPDIYEELDDELKEGLPYGENPFMYPVTIDDYYILSENFYNKDETNQSRFELAIRDHINGKPVNRKLLKAFCESYHLWGSLERFYYTPLLIMMIKSVIRGS